MGKYESLQEFLKDASQLSDLSVTDPSFGSVAERLVKFLQEPGSETESLRRYRETRTRMGQPEKDRTAPPNFPYTIHSS